MERDADNEVINYDVWLSEDSGYYSLNEDERSNFGLLSYSS